MAKEIKFEGAPSSPLEVIERLANNFPYVQNLAQALMTMAPDDEQIQARVGSDLNKAQDKFMEAMWWFQQAARDIPEGEQA